MLPWPDSLVFKAVDHTLDELPEVFDRAIDERPQLREDVLPRYEGSVDTVGNAMELTAEGPRPGQLKGLSDSQA